jgi:hypothetical protein
MTASQALRTSGTPSGTASPTTTSRAMGSDLAQALQALLAAEQAAVYAFGVVGAQGAAADRTQAGVALQKHAARRDLVAARLSAAGRTPPPAPPGYTLPFPVHTPVQARALAAHIESAVSDANADLVAATPPADRLEPARWLAESAQAAALRWGAQMVAFPGMPERAEA